MSERTEAKLQNRVRLLWDPGVVAVNQAIELEERLPAHGTSRIVFGVCTLIIGALLWSAFARLDIVADARGQITPSGELVAVQHVEGGTIAEILVSDGEHVDAGQTLVRLAPFDSQSRIDQLLAKRAAHRLAIESERAIAEGRKPDYDAAVSGYDALKAEQLSYYSARQRSQRQGASVLGQQIKERQTSVGRFETQLAVLERDENHAEAELVRSKDLFDRQLTTRASLNASEREASDVKKRHLETRDELSRTRSELLEYEQRLTDFDAKFRAESRDLIAKRSSDLEEVEAQLSSERTRAERLDVKAPLAGFVNNMSVKAINAVVRPGEPFMQIVPSEDPLVVLADVSPQDIAYISPGQPASIRVSAFDYSMFGTLPGTVEKVSPSTFADKDGRQYYRMRVRLDRDYFGKDREAGRVIPGMEAQVDVKTGSRSVLSYVLKPVTRGWDTAVR